ncbi:MAG TPA: hypothetical protein VIJ47_03165 [Acidimicrobiales bacterium]
MLTRPAVTEPSTVAGRAPACGRGAPQWIHNGWLDAAVALAWIPFVVAVHLAESDPRLLRALISATFLLSFAHQPLTLALVYGDAEQFRLRRALFTLSPVVFAVAIAVATQFDPLILAVVAGAWNAEHTLMQRYGITRIYGRKVGQSDGRVEKAMLFSWLALAVVVVMADGRTPGRLTRMQLGETNRLAVETLSRYRSVLAVLVVPIAVVAVALMVTWVRAEWRAGSRANPAKWVYVATTASLFAVILVDPIAGLMGYVGAHAIEYFVIVHQSLGRRYGDAGTGRASPLGRAVRARPGRVGFLAVYLGVVLAIVTLLQWYGSVTAYLVVFFTLGGLHVFYDGFIWKLRRPAVAHSLALPTNAA